MVAQACNPSYIRSIAVQGQLGEKFQESSSQSWVCGGA
jgi:hypothetical protein